MSGGILKADWLAKHRGRRPSVALFFLPRWVEAREWDAAARMAGEWDAAARMASWVCRAGGGVGVQRMGWCPRSCVAGGCKRTRLWLWGSAAHTSLVRSDLEGDSSTFDRMLSTLKYVRDAVSDQCEGDGVTLPRCCWASADSTLSWA